MQRVVGEERSQATPGEARGLALNQLTQSGPASFFAACGRYAGGLQEDGGESTRQRQGLVPRARLRPTKQDSLMVTNQTHADCSADARPIEAFVPCKHQNLDGLAVMESVRSVDKARRLESSTRGFKFKGCLFQRSAQEVGHKFKPQSRL
jgi:hypothetical protein